jgi:hypothetical protein
LFTQLGLRRVAARNQPLCRCDEAESLTRDDHGHNAHATTRRLYDQAMPLKTAPVATPMATAIVT